MYARASRDTLSALLLLAKHGQAFEVSGGEWKVKGTSEKIPQKRMNGLIAFGYVRRLSSSTRIKQVGKEEIITAIREGRLPPEARKYVAKKTDRRSVIHASA